MSDKENLLLMSLLAIVVAALLGFLSYIFICEAWDRPLLMEMRELKVEALKKYLKDGGPIPPHAFQ